MAARDLPITSTEGQMPLGVISINDNLEAFVSRGLEFIISPVLVSEHGKREKKVIGFTIRALGSEPSVSRAAMIAPNHPVNRENSEGHFISESKSSFPEEGRKIMGDNQVVKVVTDE